MKKLAILILFMTVAFSGFAQDNTKRVYKNFDSSKLPPLERWEPFQLGIGMNFPESIRRSNVFGLKLGVPFSAGEGRVYGVELSLFASNTDVIKGLQAAVFANVTKIIQGVQAGLVNVADVTVDGLQLGLVNYSKDNAFQIGLVNVLPKGKLPFMPFINFHLVSDFRTYEQDQPDDY